jgi:RHS repeat-associated protein
LLESLTNTDKNGVEIDSYSYEYDNNGNITAKHDVKGTTSYLYDDLNRLRTVTEPGGKATAYTYDAAGNRKTEVITLNGVYDKTITYTYDNLNQLLNVTYSGSENYTDSYFYDANGNLIRTEKNTNGEITTSINIYDNVNNLVKVINTSDEYKYQYNGEGYRVRTEVDGKIVYNLLEYDKIVLEVDENGNEIGRNVYGINLLTREADGATYNYLYNGHGDVTALVDLSGTVVGTYYYDAFGNILEQTGDVNNNITYAGYIYDEETGLYYLNARHYDPVTARFLQQDTYTGQLNDPLSLNLYSYANNNPLIYYDPTGHWESEVEENHAKSNWNKEDYEAVNTYGVLWSTANTQYLLTKDPIYLERMERYHKAANEIRKKYLFEQLFGPPLDAHDIMYKDTELKIGIVIPMTGSADIIQPLLGLLATLGLIDGAMNGFDTSFPLEAGTTVHDGNDIVEPLTLTIFQKEIIHEEFNTANKSQGIVIDTNTAHDDSGIVADTVITTFPNDDYWSMDDFVLESSSNQVVGGELSRSGALNQAKRDARIHRSQEPFDIKYEYMRTAPSEGGHIIKDANGCPILTREYYYKNNAGEIIVIQEHSAGHEKGNQGPHFNVRPADDTRNGSVSGTQDHYPFNK